MEDLARRVLGVRALREQVRLRVEHQLEHFVRERDAPRLVEALRQLREHEAVGDAAVVELVVAERILRILRAVAEIDHFFAAVGRSVRERAD